jgi:hypothetical protein
VARESYKRISNLLHENLSIASSLSNVIRSPPLVYFSGVGGWVRKVLE